MDNTQRSLSIGIVVLACSALFIAPPGMAQSPDVPVSLPPQASPSGVAVLVTRPVNCDAGQTLQRAIDTSNPGDTLSVSGTCNENVVVREEIRRITLDGQGSVTINSPDPSNFTVEIRGTGITVRGFTVTGGFRGINIGNGGTAVIDSNVIEGNGVGILLTRNASARIVNNTIRFNGTGGINISSDSSAFIGIFNPNDTLANPNTIVSNGGAGININRSSNARIVGNQISGNSGAGVTIGAVSSADLSSNTIDSNSGGGIRITQNSGVQLGNDSGNGIFDLPNSGSNFGKGIVCRINSYADGRLGGLTGITGAKDFSLSEGCVDSLLP